jgi:hypothetical protein
MKLNKYQKQAIVKAIMADTPKPDMTKRRAAIQAGVVKLMSPAVRRVYNTTPKALQTHYVGYLCYDGTNQNDRDIVKGDADEKDISAIIAPYEAEDEARREAEGNLRGVVEACSTLKQLKERLPEFIKYFPTEQAPTSNLPALANVVADLSRLGWPKGELK